MPANARTPIALDTSIMLNFIKVERLTLLGRLGQSLVIPDHVRSEVRRPVQIEMADCAIADGIFTVEAVTDPAEMSLFVALRAEGRLGAGECAVLAMAVNRSWAAGIQDRRARTEAKRRRATLQLVDTEDLVLCLIRRGALTPEEADGMLAEWAVRHRFRSRIATFRDLL
jgi:predicted nucleic acid-binding protein